MLKKILDAIGVATKPASGAPTVARPAPYADDARDTLYDPLDFRAGYATTHYLGGGVEWWFNSSYR